MGQLDDTIAFAFSDSALIDDAGNLLGDSYKFYYREAVGDRMDSDFTVTGEEFVRQCLLERNLILNVSSVVWERECLEKGLELCIEELIRYKLTGDWHLYAKTALLGKRISYVSEPLNFHRRHNRSVTGALEKKQHVDEVRRVHKYIAEWLSADAAERRRMAAYEAQLKEQFGLSASPPSDG
jgi:hypothetical protein